MLFIYPVEVVTAIHRAAINKIKQDLKAGYITKDEQSEIMGMKSNNFLTGALATAIEVERAHDE